MNLSNKRWIISEHTSVTNSVISQLFEWEIPVSPSGCFSRIGIGKFSLPENLR